MTYEEYKEISKTLDASLSKASKALREFPRGDMGLVPDAVRTTPEYKYAKSEYDNLFAVVREFNGRVPKEYMRKARDERRAGTY